jgi:hypothetical protein
MGCKYFLLKKKYYSLKIKTDPDVIETSPFLQLVQTYGYNKPRN